MGPDRDQTRDPWICSQTRYWLRYAAQYLTLLLQNNQKKNFRVMQKSYIYNTEKHYHANLKQYWSTVIPIQQFY